MEKIAYYDDCVRYALEQRGISENNFENTDMRVYQRSVANPTTVFKALRKGAVIIPVVTTSLFEQQEGNVATVLLAVDSDRKTVTIYNPLAKHTCEKPTDEFVRAWETAGGQCTTAFDRDDSYVPKLIDLSHVELPGDLGELLEAIAENAHNMWALERQSEGWTYGPERNDQLLETPDMVSYDELDESEKEYDRVMAKDTLKLLMALGYKVVKNG